MNLSAISKIVKIHRFGSKSSFACIAEKLTLMFHFKIEWEFTAWVIWETDLLTQPGYLSSSKHLLIVMPSSKADITNHPVHMWSLRLTSQSSSPSPSSGSDSENTSYAWFEWDAIIDLDWKYANTSNLQTCKLSWCLSASQSSNRAAKWLHVDSPTALRESGRDIV